MVAVDQWLAVGGAGNYEPGRVWTSRDRAAWFPRPPFDSGQVRHGRWVETLGRFVLVGQYGRNWTSVDGLEIVAGTAASRDMDRMAWSESLGLLVAVGHTYAQTSPDGKVWTERALPDFGEHAYDIARNENLGLFAVARSNGKIATSPNGQTWTSRSAPVDQPYRMVATLTGFVAFDQFEASVATTPDGQAWTKRSTPGTGGFTAATAGFGGTPYGCTDTGQVVRGSFSDATWTVVATLREPLRDLTYTPFPDALGGWFIGVSDTAIWESLDGENWVEHPAPWAAASSKPVGVVGGRPENLAPLAPTLLTPLNVPVDVAKPVVFGWRFEDSDPGDRQTGYQLNYRPVGASTWQTINATSPDQSHELPAQSLVLGGYEWRVFCADLVGHWSPASDSGFFTVGNAPDTPVITSPADGSTVGTGTALLEWSSTVQAGFQVRKLSDTGLVLFDSGHQTGAAKAWLLSFPVNHRTEQLQVRVIDGGLWSDWATVEINVDYLTPAEPVLGVEIARWRGLEAALRYTVDAQPPGPGEPTVVTVDVWRRAEGETEGVRVVEGLAPSHYFDDYAVASGVEYEIRAQAHGDNGTSSWSEWVGIAATEYLELDGGGYLELAGRDWQ